MQSDLFNSKAEDLDVYSLKASNVKFTIENLNSLSHYNKPAFELGLLATKCILDYKTLFKCCYEVCSQYCGFVSGPSSGTCTLEHVVGPTPIAFYAYSLLGDISQVRHNQLKLSYTVPTECRSVSLRKMKHDLQPAITLKYVFMNDYHCEFSSGNMSITDRAMIEFRDMHLARKNFRV